MNEKQTPRTMTDALQIIEEQNEIIKITESKLSAVTEQRDRLAEILSDIMTGYDETTETASICAVYAGTTIKKALQTLNPKNETR